MKHLIDTFDAARLRALLSRFKKLRMAVLGDFFLDQYFEIDSACVETSVETGRQAHQVTATRHAPGAAGTVVNNLAALGVRSLSALGVTGEDGNGWTLRRDLEAAGCDLAHLQADAACVTPTYLKTRDRTLSGLEGERDRFDIKNRTPLPERIRKALLASVDLLLPALDALIIMDQVPEEGCGVMSQTLIDALSERAKHNPKTLFWADSRRRIHRYRQITLKANQFELAGVSAPLPGASVPDAALSHAAAMFAGRAGAPVFVTAEARGVRVAGPLSVTVPPVRVTGPIDPTGAGDAFTAGAAAALAAGATHPEAALIGNLTASVTIRQLGTTGTAAPSDLSAALALWREQQS
ncbi:MAG TPA: PfkB family carbohydrate kinase [Kiritimatiellia bacterium]|nr:PfkB family carbohydrate kinase [Kiritimatiellia bacterium]HQQ91418.1 PfkB family carbohydrate kinase [Kiritimatiellia bacterium]